MRRYSNANKALREKINECGLKHKQVAAKLGITPNSFSRMMSNELRDGRRFEVLKAIRDCTKERAEHFAHAFEGVTAEELFEAMWGGRDDDN